MGKMRLMPQRRRLTNPKFTPEGVLGGQLGPHHLGTEAVGLELLGDEEVLAIAHLSLDAEGLHPLAELVPKRIGRPGDDLVDGDPGGQAEDHLLIVAVLVELDLDDVGWVVRIALVSAIAAETQDSLLKLHCCPSLGVCVYKSKA